MYKGIYIAVSGAVLKQKQLDVVSQNLANAATAGYRKETLSFREYLLPQSPAAGPDGRVMTALGTHATDFSNGTVTATGNALDIAIEGDGFIALEGNRFTRRGDLRRDAEGYLVAGDGRRVLGSGGGPIRLPEGAVEIKANGAITVDGAEIGAILIRSFPDPAALVKAGNSVFVATQPGVESTATVRQAALESSNVEVVSEMVRMIGIVREFEAFQKAIQTFDEATAKVNNEIGRIL